MRTVTKRATKRQAPLVMRTRLPQGQAGFIATLISIPN